MKFIAILKDSLRETLDAKLFYVMVGLSLLTVLLATSVTYTPISAEQRLKANMGFANMIFASQPGMERLRLRLEIENFERRDSRTEPWLGDYQFDQVVSLAVAESAGKPTKADLKTLEELKEKFKERLTVEGVTRQMGELFREVEVKEIIPKGLPEGTDEIRYRIKTTGTNVKSRQEWFHQPGLFFGAVDLPVKIFSMATIIWFISTWVIGTFGAAFTMLISIIITASFLPNMLAKGTVDLLLVKPVHRIRLFVYKFLGGLLFMFLNTAFIMSGLYLAIGLQTGVWLSSLFLLILVYTALFAILYSISAVTAVLTRSPIVCILISSLAWMGLFGLGWAHWGFIENRKEGAAEPAEQETREHWAFIGFDLFYKITPRYKEIDWLGSKAVEEELIRPQTEAITAPGDKESAEVSEKRQKQAKAVYEKQRAAIDKRFGTYSWTPSLIATSVFILLMLGLACWRFSVKDY